LPTSLQPLSFQEVAENLEGGKARYKPFCPNLEGVEKKRHTVFPLSSLPTSEKMWVTAIPEGEGGER
jgi:hypothetical protein